MLFLQLSRALASSTRITEVLKTDVDLTDENAGQKDKKVETAELNLKMFLSSITKNVKKTYLKIFRLPQSREKLSV